MPAPWTIADRGHVAAKGERNAHHALTTYQPHLEGALAFDQRQQRYHAIVGKVHVLDRVPGLIEDIAEIKRCHLKAAQQSLTMQLWQCGEHAVGKRFQPGRLRRRLFVRLVRPLAAHKTGRARKERSSDSAEDPKYRHSVQR